VRAVAYRNVPRNKCLGKYSVVELGRVRLFSFAVTMSEDVVSGGHGKARSMSICGAGSSSMEAIAGAQPRRRRPAARSQSARAPAGRPARRRPANTLAPAQAPARYSSEPRLSEAETPPPVRRQASARRRPQHSPAHRRSAAFLDVPKTLSPAMDLEPDEDSYRLRTFNVNHKGGNQKIINKYISNSIIIPSYKSQTSVDPKLKD